MLQLLIEYQMNQKYCVSYFTEIDSVFALLDQFWIRQYVLDILLCYLVVHLVIEEWMEQTKCVSYSNINDSVLLHNLTNKNYDTMCYLIYFVHLWINISLKNAWSRHSVIDILIFCIQFCCTIWQMKNKTLCVSKSNVL